MILTTPTNHIEAKRSEVGKTVFICGDPLRAKWISETYLSASLCFNTQRNMFGYTGVSKEKEEVISVMGTGMGMPSTGIYVTELLCGYGVKRIIRIGSAGSLKPDIGLGDIVIGGASVTDSKMFPELFNGKDPTVYATIELVDKAENIAQEENIPTKTGTIYSTDIFYDERNIWKSYARLGAIAVEMESAALFALCARYGAEALTLLTISDNLVTGEKMPKETRERGFGEMMKIAMKL